MTTDIKAPSDDLLAFAITETFGKRCPTADPDCYACQAWAQYDKLNTLATPPAPTPSAARERIARIVDPMFRDPLALSLCEARTEKALAKADAILALLPDAAAIRADERKMCLSIIENLRIAGATNFKDARHSGQRGADFCDALHDAYQAIRAAGEK